MTATRRPSGDAFDLDGTLIDSVYQHVLAWKEVLTGVGTELSVWRLQCVTTTPQQPDDSAGRRRHRPRTPTSLSNMD